MKKNLLLTGRPGVGKTTLVKKIIHAFRSMKVAGFLTEEFRGEDGSRQGFRLETLDGEKGILSEVGLPSPKHVGKYGVNLKAIETIINPALEHALQCADLIVLDEIGKMELASKAFGDLVVRGLDSPIPVLATVPVYHLALVDEIKKRADVSIIEVTGKNRDTLDLEMISKLKDLIGHQAKM